MSDLTILRFEDLPPPDMMQIYLLDLTAAIRTIVGKLTTIRDLPSKVMASVPKHFKIIYMVCDTYKINSIKREEPETSGPSTKVPHDFANFLHNGDNKEMLFNLIQQSIEEAKKEPWRKDCTLFEQG